MIENDRTAIRMGDSVDDCSGLENRRACERTVGSNPTPSAKPEPAARVRGRIEAILNAAQVQNLRKGENPAAWRGHLALLMPAHAEVKTFEHHAAAAHAAGRWRARS